MKRALISDQIFTGEKLLEDHAIVLNGSMIESIVSRSELSSEIDCELVDALIIPGFIDLQVNGGGGVMFNSSPTVEGIRTIGEAHRQFGTTSFMPTLITASFEVMREAVAAVAEAIEKGVPGVLGIHLEGPFLNAERKGAHDEEKFCVIEEDGLEILTSLAAGKTLVTIAPELTSADVIRRITSQGVVVSAGHSGADYHQAREALKSGVTGFTHLYNGMTPLQSRDPGMVGAALEDEESWFGIIADGFHMHPAAFKVAVSAKQRSGAILVTDAMATVGAKDTSFELDDETIFAIDGRCVNAAGSLAGSDLDMITAVNNAAKFARIDWLEAVRMASIYPAKALGMDDCLGYIKPGYQANFVAVDKQRKVINTWVDGA